jgi:geranylgeranyl pyrophosphate synthase
MTADAVNQTKNLIKEISALDATRQLKDELLNEGQKILDKVQPPMDPKYNDFLLELSTFLIKKNY